MLKRLWLDATENFAPLNKEEGKLSVGQMKWIPANDKLHVKAETGRGNEETLTAGRDPPLGNERHRPWLLKVVKGLQKAKMEESGAEQRCSLRAG